MTDRPGEEPPTPPPASPGPGSEKDRALAALQNLAKPKPRANPIPPGEFAPVQPPAAQPASGPSGFVSMLAKGQLGSGDSHVFPTHPRGGASGKSRYPLHMAREISHPAQGGAKDQAAAVAAPRRSASPPPPSPPPPSPPRRIGILMPLLLLMALAVLLIGLWAAGALLYMNTVMPAEPSESRYPLIQWSFTAGESGDFTPGSRLMAWSMLAALPVGVILFIAALALRRRRSPPVVPIADPPTL